MNRKAFHDTTVTAGKTRGEIDGLLFKHGADAVRWTTLTDSALLEFKSPAGSFAIRVAWEMGDAKTPAQRERQAMRALQWHVKALFDAVDFGIVDMTRAFMPHLITGPNRTLGDDVLMAIEQRSLGIDVPLLPEAR